MAMHQKSGLAVCMVLCAWASFVGFAQQGSALEYEAREAGTLIHISKKVYGKPHFYKIIALLNGVDEKHYASPGETFLIPNLPDRAQPAARVVDLQGDVQQVTVGEKKARDVSRDRALVWMDGVKTGPSSRATVQFSNGARCILKPNSELVVLGEHDGEHLVYMRSGGLVWESGSKEGRIRLATRDGAAHVKGRSVLFELERGKYRIAALDGSVRFGSITVQKGQWGFGHPKLKFHPKPLPKPPQFHLEGAFHDANRNAYVLFADSPRSSLRALWSAQKDAQVEISVRPIHTQGQPAGATYSGKETTHTFSVEGSGVWDIRARSVNHLGIAGPWKTTTILRAHTRRSAHHPVQFTAQGFAAVGRGELQLAGSPKPSLLMRVQHADPSTCALKGPTSCPWTALSDTNSTALTGLQHNAVWLEVSGHALSSPIRARVPLKIAPIPNVSITHTPQHIDPLATESFEVRVVLSKSASDAVVGESPRVELGRRSCNAEPTDTPGEYMCVLRPKVTLGKDSEVLRVYGASGSFRVERSVPVLVPDPKALPLR